MAIDPQFLLALDIPDVEHTYTAKDTMLYALGLGLGHDPMNEDELAFVYEKNLRALPTMVCVLGQSRWWREQPTGIDWLKVVHGEQSFRIHRPLAPSGTLIGKSRITDIVDKGAGKGAVLHTERTLWDKTLARRSQRWCTRRSAAATAASAGQSARARRRMPSRTARRTRCAICRRGRRRR